MKSDIKMEESKNSILSFASTFDYTQFLDSGFLSDCKLIIPNDGEQSEINAHIFILANSCQYFHDAFTGEMKEAQTHIVKITHNPQNLFPRVIKFLYNGKIEWEMKEMMSLFSIARFYKIDCLYKALDAKLNEIMAKDSALQFVSSCYDNQLTNELNYMIPFITKHFDLFKISELSDALDVKTFAKVIEPIKGSLGTDKLLDVITKFVGDYKFENREEQSALLLLLPRAEKGLKEKIMKKGCPWVPEPFLNTLK